MGALGQYMMVNNEYLNSLMELEACNLRIL